MVDSEALLQHLLNRTPCELFHSPLLAFELVCFCRDNLPLFGRNLDILKRSFPNLLKARSTVLGQSWGDRGLGTRAEGELWGRLGSVCHTEACPHQGQPCADLQRNGGGGGNGA